MWSTSHSLPLTGHVFPSAAYRKQPPVARQRSCKAQLHAAPALLASTSGYVGVLSVGTVGKAFLLLFFQQRSRCIAWTKAATLFVMEKGRLLQPNRHVLVLAETKPSEKGSKGKRLLLRLRYKVDSANKGGSKRTRLRQVIRSVVTLLGCAEAPLILWSWAAIAIESLSGVHFQSPSKPIHGELRWVPVALQKIQPVVLLTALAWFAHRLISWWRSKRSRGRPRDDSLTLTGWESSLKEAQVHAFMVSLQVVVWTLYTLACLWVLGIEVQRVLLFPSVTAVLIGWIGREVVANILSGFVLHITQPFAQGDWVSMENESIDGWVQNTGTFYTRIVQWDKRPVYIPNFKLMSMNIQNNSRMTNRRILFNLPLRLRDIPNIPQIVQDMQEMIIEHEDIDPVQHRIVRWRSVGTYSADIWLSCYTLPTSEGIGLRNFSSVQQSILERCSQIIYKHDAHFASVTDRYRTDSERSNSSIANGFFKSFASLTSDQESALESREQVLRQRERELKERERQNEVEAEELVARTAALARKKDRCKEMLVVQPPNVADSTPDRPEEECSLVWVGDSVACAEDIISAEACVGDMSVAETDAPGSMSEQLDNSGEQISMMKESEVDITVELVKEEDEEEVHLEPPACHADDLEAFGMDTNITEGAVKSIHDGEKLHKRQAEELRIPVKEMGD